METKNWFDTFRDSEHFRFLQKKPIAYFCIEYALSDLLPTYAGGLGVLAGDYVKELYDQQIPAVAVGLMYHSVYGAYGIVHGQAEKEVHPEEHVEPNLKPVLDENQNPLVIKVPIRDADVFVKAWLWEKDTIKVYLLDTDVAENTPDNRGITYKLYDSDKEVRIKQELVLGIGGFRLLEALGLEPSIYHMNEGHSALLDLEIIRHEMHKRKISFQEAQSLSTHHVVFTNHTLVPAGNEIFSTELFTLMMEKYALDLEVPVTEIAALGTIPEVHSISLSLFGMRFAGKINAVSKLHAEEAAKTWSGYTFEAVTNGIHIPTWDRLPADTSLPAAHVEHKKKLLEYIKEKTGEEWKENELLLGWARRMVPYKRPLALFGELERFKQIAFTSDRPVKVVITGIAHQGDNDGREIIRKLHEMIEKDLLHSVVFLPTYSTAVAKLLTSGCDVWLNTPVVGSEACGTSGMKACLNGVLPCTTKDGWVYEIDIPEVGWEVQSDIVSKSVLDIVEKEMIPMFYGNDKKAWEEKMQKARVLIQNDYSATRMLKEYFEKLYIPILTASYTHYLSK
jgi:starch phosphorylase